MKLPDLLLIAASAVITTRVIDQWSAGQDKRRLREMGRRIGAQALMTESALGHDHDGYITRRKG
jgi:hypothetical protein